MLLPERPILRSILSVTNATLAIYPLSSSIERKKNSITMIGRKLSTEPTPPKMPSTTSERTAGLTPQRSSAAATPSPSAPMPASSHSCSGAPSTSMVSQITSAITIRKIGMAVHFPVRTLSILRLRLYSLLCFGLTTVFSQSLWIKLYRISAMAAARSSPRSASISQIMCSMASLSFWSSLRASSTRLSPSTSLLAAKRTGMPAAAA